MVLFAPVPMVLLQSPVGIVRTPARPCDDGSSCCSFFMLLFLLVFPRLALTIFGLTMIFSFVSFVVERLLHLGLKREPVRFSAKDKCRRGRWACCQSSTSDPFAEQLVHLMHDAQDKVSATDLSTGRVSTSATHYDVVVTTPGMKREELKVEMSDGHILRITGESSRGYSVDRTVVLPKDANLDGIVATYSHGSLEIRLQRRAPRVVPIAQKSGDVSTKTTATQAGVEQKKASAEPSATPSTLLSEVPASPGNVQSPDERCDVVDTGEEDWEAIGASEPSSES